MNKDSDLECIFFEHTMEKFSKTQAFQERERQWMVPYKNNDYFM